MTVSLRTTGFDTSVTVISDRGNVGLDWLDAWIEHKVAVLSRFEPSSELSRLNASAGRWTEVSPVLWNLIEAAVAVARATDGLVTPTVLSALVAAGYDRSFRLGLDDGGSAQAVARNVPPIDCIELDENRRAVRLPVGAGLDFGGIAKGYLAESLAEELGAPCLVDLGGDIAVRGPRHNGTAWVIETEPASLGIARSMLLELGGIATSGIDQRRWMRCGQQNHHIIDPRSGGVAETDLLRATILAPTALLAEAVAKLALLLGLQRALEFVEARSELAALFVTRSGDERQSARLAHFVWEEHE